MTGGALHAVGGSLAEGWLERLRGELRPEFTGGVIVAAAGGRVLAGSPCLVPGCVRASAAARLCAAHWSRWYLAGRAGRGVGGLRAGAAQGGAAAAPL